MDWCERLWAAQCAEPQMQRTLIWVECSALVPGGPLSRRGSVDVRLQPKTRSCARPTLFFQRIFGTARTPGPDTAPPARPTPTPAPSPPPVHTHTERVQPRATARGHLPPASPLRTSAAGEGSRAGGGLGCGGVSFELRGARGRLTFLNPPPPNRRLPSPPPRGRRWPQHSSRSLQPLRAAACAARAREDNGGS